MRKFLSVLLTLCMALCLGLTLVGCNPPAPEGPGGPEGPSGPTYSSITEAEWFDLLLCSPKNEVYVVETERAGKAAQFWISAYEVNFNPDGIHPLNESNITKVNQIIDMFGFYQAFDFADLTFDTTNNTYSYASPVVVDVPSLQHYSADGVIAYTYTNIVITLGQNEFDETVIGSISLTRTRNFEDSSYDTTANITLEYTFGD